MGTDTWRGSATCRLSPAHGIWMCVLLGPCGPTQHAWPLLILTEVPHGLVAPGQKPSVWERASLAEGHGELQGPRDPPCGVLGWAGALWSQQNRVGAGPVEGRSSVAATSVVGTARTAPEVAWYGRCLVAVAVVPSLCFVSVVAISRGSCPLPSGGTYHLSGPPPGALSPLVPGDLRRQLWSHQFRPDASAGPLEPRTRLCPGQGCRPGCRRPHRRAASSSPPAGPVSPAPTSPAPCRLASPLPPPSALRYVLRVLASSGSLSLPCSTTALGRSHPLLPWAVWAAPALALCPGGRGSGPGCPRRWGEKRPRASGDSGLARAWLTSRTSPSAVFLLGCVWFCCRRRQARAGPSVCPLGLAPRGTAGAAAREAGVRLRPFSHGAPVPGLAGDGPAAAGSRQRGRGLRPAAACPRPLL